MLTNSMFTLGSNPVLCRVIRNRVVISATLFTMTVNRLLLLLDSLLLLLLPLLLVQRMQSEGGHLGWMGGLPWGSFETKT